ncbi:APC family permease [Acidihalobacter ferrooxydans]|uniref:Amino acid permease/ SLC12A domain-containing protein n=1 Tax=Acidihalobacter ferrooxydans TaxID=1765967 RepID=A0A1P8UE74_9GAMM|nr:APC family permease [Acidihalobacter ferrooxydans]APZ42098.1 hypothetical protein BW247_02470 [Acidihalobacter ferrooxydans]
MSESKSTTPGLSATLGPVEAFGQSIANVSPTFTPTLNITVVVAFAGFLAWPSYLIATLGLFLVAWSMGTLARRHPTSGSFFLYIGRNFGPLSGMLAGAAMISAYLFTGIAVIIGAGIFLNNMLEAMGLAVHVPHYLFYAVFTAILGYFAYRDVKLSSRLALILEALSVVIITAVVIAAVVHHGTLIDPQQFSFNLADMSKVGPAMAFAIFSFVGFESAATLSKEIKDPSRSVPFIIRATPVVAGLFFAVIAYLMILASGDNVKLLGSSAAPLVDITRSLGVTWLAAVIYAAAFLAAFSCALASLNAASRLIYSMGRYRFVHSSMGAVHANHGTPHFALGVGAAVMLVVCEALVPAAPLNAFGWTGTYAAFGFVLVYLGVALAGVREAFQFGTTGTRKAVDSVLGIGGALIMAYVLYGSLYPAPAYPFNLLPYLFAASLLVVAGWYVVLKTRVPQVLAGISTMDLD